MKSLIAENKGIQSEKELTEEHNKQVTIADTHTYVETPRWRHREVKTQRGVHFSRALIGIPNKES